MDRRASEEYEEKLRIIEESKNNTLSADDVGDILSELSKILADELPKAAKATFGTIAKTLTPSFMNRLQNKKIHAQKIQEMEK